MPLMFQAKTIIIIVACLELAQNWSFTTSFTPSGNDKIYCLDISADGTKLAVGGQAQKVVIFETATFTQIGIYNAPHIPKAIKFSPDGNYIAVGYQIDTLTILSGTTYTLVQSLGTGHSKVHDIDFNVDSTSMITCGDNNKFRIWDTSTWTSTFTCTDLGQVIWKCIFASNGKYAIGLDPGRVRIYSTGNSQLSTYIPGSTGKPYGLDFKYGTNDFIMGSDNSNGYLSSSSSTFLSTSGIIWVAKYAKTTDYFMFAGEDYKVHIFNSTNQEQFTFTPGSNKLYCGDFSDAGCLLALGSQDNKVYIYSSALGSCTPPTPPTPSPTPTEEDNSTNCTSGYYEDDNGDCKLCISSIPGCGVCSSLTQCLYCLPGTYLDSGACSNCESAIQGCLICNQSSNCLQCQNDYYLELGNCESCTQVENCLRCSSSSTCLACKFGYYESGGDCYICPSGCKDCSDSSTCLSCEATHTLDGSSCSLCQDFIEGCFICSDTSTCTSCLSGFYISNDECKPCKQSLDGCLLCSDINTCIQCESGFHLDGITCSECSLVLDGCVYCDNSTYCNQCQVGYHKDQSDSCQLCSESIQGCLFCSGSSTCSLCKAGYQLNTNTNICEIIPQEQVQQIVCNIPYCMDCIRNNVTNQTECSRCLPSHYQIDEMQCGACSYAIKGCEQCLDSQTCIICDINYYLSSDSICQLCSHSLQGCSLCNSSSYCLDCKQGYYYNDGECSLCQSVEGCVRCSSQNTCNQCKGGYFVNETSGCQPCTDLLGCSFCESKQKCLSCIVGYYNHQGQCQPCSYISNCFHCIDSVCVLCNNGYSLVEGTCEVLTISQTDKKQVKNISLSLKTHYISENQLKHTLFVRGAKFVHLEFNWSSLTTMKIKNPNGEQTLLKITNVQWGSNGYTLIYFTNNPYKITIQDIAKMNLTRRLLQSSIVSNYEIQMDMQKTALSEILPDYRSQGEGLVMQYSLDKPEFVKTIFQGFNAYSYHLFGIIIVSIFFVQYLVKALFTHPVTMDFGQIIPHILALKTGILILYPTYLEYFDFCYGFYVADFPWANNQVGEALGNESDTQPFAYASLYINMNFASTYLIAFSVVCGLALILFILSKKFEHQQRIKNSFEFLYCFFIFGLTLAGCASLQGAMMNPLSQITVNAFFYILGIIVYCAVAIECIYQIRKDIKYIWKLRILIKATLLSLAHLNPIYLTAIAIIIDISLAIADYKMIKKSPKYIQIVLYPTLWLVDNIIINLALGLLIFLPSILLEIILISLLVTFLILSSIFVHVQQILKNRKIQIQKSNSSTENQLNNQELFKQQESDLKRNDTDQSQVGFYKKTQENLIKDINDQEEEVRDEKLLVFDNQIHLRSKNKKRKRNKAAIIKEDIAPHQDVVYLEEDA